MSKIANVVFAYSPKNDDELELTVGDKIEILGYEEEGWWKGKLKGRIGVFPSNFVHVETSATTPSETSSPIQQQHSATSNKLNSIFASKLSSKSSLSSNSLNTINSTSNNSLNNNIGNNTNLNMNGSNNTHQLPPHPTTDAVSDSVHHNESNNNSFNELRPKPIRGVGYGDIFAAGAKTKSSQTSESTKATVGSVGSIVASERMNNSIIGSTLQKPIPKKPPPPTPGPGGNNHDGAASSQNGSINSTSDQAPALPPKPSNQSFSPFMQQTRVLQQQSTSVAQSPSQRGARLQARVIHAYEPTNADELELKVNDIINIIDKKSEDYGWWKGELNGKIGVFPDNFVQEITVQDQQMPSQVSSSVGTNQSDWPINRVGTSSGAATTATSSVFSPPQQQISSTEGRVKSVFSSTPKGFSKELESNLEKHNNPASFLSLKRNKLSGQSTITNDSNLITANTAQMNIGFVSSGRNETVTTTNSAGTNGDSMMNNLLDNSSPTKLNHITANRAKGPSRRPPSNILNRRNQASTDLYGSLKKESSSNDSSREEQPSMIGLPIATTSPTSVTTLNSYHDTLPSLPSEPISQQQQKRSPSAGPVSTSPFTSSASMVAPSGTNASPSTIRPSSITGTVDNQIGASSTATVTPKTSQRMSQQQIVSDNVVVKGGQKTPTGSPPTSTPPWMVNLRKTNAEKKRDPVTTSTPSTPTIQANNTTAPLPVAPSSVVVASSGTTMYPIATFLNNGQDDNEDAQSHQVHAKHEENHNGSVQAQTPANLVSVTQLNESLAKYDNLYKQISKDVTSELSELKRDVKQLQQDLSGINEIKSAIETMKIELKACQSATENQRKYIKELVNNLSDERKKIAAMQEELDRNLK